MARPISQADRKLFLERLRAGDTYEVAGKTANHNRFSFYYLIKKDEEFAKEVAEAAKAGIDILEQQLIKYGLGQEPVKNASQVTALFGVLKARDPKRWTDKGQLEVALGNARGKSLQVEAVGVSLREILELARKVGAGRAEGDAGHQQSVPNTSEVLPAGDKPAGDISTADGISTS